jgi:hypothetical protein
MIGFQENRANELMVEDGKLTGEVAEPIPGPRAKLATLTELRESFDLDNIDTLVVGDGANDLGMIEAPASASPTTPSRRWPPRRRRGSITAISPHCSTRRGIGGRSLWGDRASSTPSSCPDLIRASIHLQKILAKKLDCWVKPG